MKKISTLFLSAAALFNTQVEGQTTYNDVATIFYAHCTVCHNNGGVAPFSLMNFQEVSPYSASIANAINTGIMPPWHADTTYVTSGHAGSRFLHENTLNATEKAAILQWVADLALEGDATLAPTAPKYGDLTYMLNGAASMTLQIPTFASNSTSSNTNPYDCFSIPTHLLQDRWLRAFEIIPGDKSIVHHVVVTVDTTGTATSQLDGNCGQQPGQFGIGGWSAGTPPTVFPDDPTFKTGIRIPAGSKLILQLHYAPGSGGKLDSTKIRLFFYPAGATGIRPIHSDVMLQNWGTFTIGAAPIPKNQITKLTATSATSQFPTAHPAQPATAMTLFAANPHSHNICTQIVNYASSGTDTLPIIKISHWDYNWQGNYYFDKPMKIPAGYTLKTEHIYNNTSSNSKINGTPVDIHFGQATSDEMLFDSFMWLDYKAGDENIDVKALLANDTLLKVGIKNIDLPSISSFIYPNPANDNITVYLTKKSVYKGRIFNIAGQTVASVETFFDRVTVDVKNIPTGLYIVEITDTKTGERISKKIVVSK